MFTCVIKSYGQLKYIEIEYKFDIKTPKGESFTFFRTLKDDGNLSLFVNKDTSLGINNMVVKADKQKDRGIFINRLEDKLYQYYPILNKDFYIKEDSISQKIQWTIIDSVKKEIMGYSCTLATCSFRGRQYQAYFSPDIPFFTGPWKLAGLPGTILDASTKDGMYRFSAYLISTNILSYKIENPYDIKQISFLTFFDHKTLFIRKISELQKKAQSQEKDEDVNYTFEDNSIELLK